MDHINEFRIRVIGNEETGGFQTGEQEVSPASQNLILKRHLVAGWRRDWRNEEMLEVERSVKRDTGGGKISKGATTAL